MVRQNPPRKAKKIPKKLSKDFKRESIENMFLVDVKPNVSLIFRKKTKVRFMDGVYLKVASEEKLLNKKRRNQGAFFLNWKECNVKALLFSTAHGDGVYNFLQKILWIDSGKVFIVAKVDYDKLTKAKKIEDSIELGQNAINDFKGKLTAFGDGYATGNDKKLIDTR